MTSTSVPGPDFSQFLASHWDTGGTLTNLGSLNDWVFRLDDDGGTPRAVVKFSTEDRLDEVSLAAEAHVLERLDSACPSLHVPTLQVGRDGHVSQSQGGTVGRMMDWVNGFALSSAPHWTASALRALGQVAGRVSRALVGVDHPGLRRFVEWDPRNAIEVVDGYLPQTSDRERALLVEALRFLREEMPARESVLPEQAVHLDLTDLNVLGFFEADGAFLPVGIIDFGDLVWTWRVCELAVSVHAAIGRSYEDPIAALTPVLKGFLDHQMLSEEEADQLWALIVARAAICVAAESVEADQAEGNAYVVRLAEIDFTVLEGVLAVDPSLARAVIRMACGLTPYPVDVAALLREAHPAQVVVGPASCHEPWLELQDIPGEAAGGDSPDALRLGARFVASGGAAVRAPLDGRVVAASAAALTLAFDLDSTPLVLHVEGITASVADGDTVDRGQVLGAVARQGDDGGSLYLQLAVAADAPPALGKVRDRAAWSALCPDPSILVGLPSVPRQPDTSELRRRHVARALRTYYREPLEIVRAHGQWMYDSTGRRYLDMVNNVAVVGHSHPRIALAAAEQLSLLNTNSRFLYRAIAEYADKIAETLPDGLQSVFFVNSGSEGLELALQLARQFTARRDMLVLEGFYHGWTTEVFELCTVPADRPHWRSELAPWVHVAECPDWFRGTPGSDAALDSLSDALTAAEVNGGIAGFVHEPIFGSLGGLKPPAGYLADAYRRVRDSGGLCIADEVQVGHGRIGESFWAFADQDVIPDIVVAAKAAGNGHPVGFVACRTEISDAFAEDSTFFSTPAGSPVSCRIGAEVLDILHDERLPQNAAAIGAFLSEHLRALADRHSEIGAVYGQGLYQGIDLVTDDGSTTPLPPAEVSAVCERLRELGFIVQPTGLHGNVLKVKPPLCIRRNDADDFVSAIDRVLTERAQFRAMSQPTTVTTTGANQ